MITPSERPKPYRHASVQVSGAGEFVAGGDEHSAQRFTDDQLRAALQRSYLPEQVRSTILAMVTHDARESGVLTLSAGALASRLGIQTRAARDRLKAARKLGAIVAIDRDGIPLPHGVRPAGGRGANGIGYSTQYRFGPALHALLWPVNQNPKGADACTPSIAAQDRPKVAASYPQECSAQPTKGAAGCTHQRYKKRQTITNYKSVPPRDMDDDNMAGGGGDARSLGWTGTDAEHAEALAVAERLGHSDPEDLVSRVVCLEQLYWLADEAAKAKAANPAGFVESRLRSGERAMPSTEQLAGIQEKREFAKRTEERRLRDEEARSQRREELYVELKAEHDTLGVLVDMQASAIAADPSAKSTAERLRQAYREGWLFDDIPEARKCRPLLERDPLDVSKFEQDIGRARKIAARVNGRATERKFPRSAILSGGLKPAASKDGNEPTRAQSPASPPSEASHS